MPVGTKDKEWPCPQGGDHDVPYTPLPQLTGISMNAELRRRGIIPAKAYRQRDIFWKYQRMFEPTE